MSRAAVRIDAPAKVNLTLTVRGRRADGFHEIESLVCPVSLCDTLDFQPRDAGGLEFHCDDPTLPTDDTNLVVRAARLFCAGCGVEPNLSIHLIKRIPHGAGLGGGSSDAAATLLGLNEIFPARFEMKELSTMAAQLGSDVPLFLYRSAARVSGRGELVEPAVFSHTLPLLLIKPPFGVPTPWAYSRWKDSQEIPGVFYAPQTFAWGTLHNDLERPVFEKYVFLATLKNWLLAQAEVAGALMSGSGATVFALLREASLSGPLGEKLASEFGPDLWLQFVETAG